MYPGQVYKGYVHPLGWQDPSTAESGIESFFGHAAVFGLALLKFNCSRNHTLLVRGFVSKAVTSARRLLDRSWWGHGISCYQTD